MRQIDKPYVEIRERPNSLVQWISHIDVRGIDEITVQKYTDEIMGDGTIDSYCSLRIYRNRNCRQYSEIEIASADLLVEIWKIHKDTEDTNSNLAII